VGLVTLQWQKKAMGRERQKLRETTSSRMCFKPTRVLIGEINRHLKGWSQYFGDGYPRQSFRRVNAYTRERLVRHLRRRSQRPYRSPKGVSWYEQLHRLGLVYL